jgi:hypothetical protein
VTRIAAVDGYYGHRNQGDDMMLVALSRILKQAGFSAIIVRSHSDDVLSGSTATSQSRPSGGEAAGSPTFSPGCPLPGKPTRSFWAEAASFLTTAGCHRRTRPYLCPAHVPAKCHGLCLPGLAPGRLASPKYDGRGGEAAGSTSA